MRIVFVPVSNIGLGWLKQDRWAEVTDHRTGRRHRFPIRRAVLRGNVLCVPGRSLAVEGELHLVKIVGLPALWVRLHAGEKTSTLAA